jgi:L-fuconolactonase
MIIDTHHHFWHYREEEYGWIDDSMEVLKRDYLPADLEAEITGAAVTGTLVVQARQVIDETRWLLELAGRNPFIRGVIGWVDLRSPRLKEQLERFSGNRKLVGVRHVIQDEPDDFMLQPAFLRGIGMLEDYQLVYDLLLFPRHLKLATALVSTFPRQRFVLDHMSKPAIRSGIMEPWRRDLEALSKQPNVWCKVSGLVTEADHQKWKFEDFIPYLEVVFNTFGTDRIMLGSDWPVCRLAGEYREVMDIPAEYMVHMDEADIRKVYRENAVQCYRLEL